MVGGRVMVVVCVWVVSRSSSHRVGARRGQQKCGLAGARSLRGRQQTETRWG